MLQFFLFAVPYVALSFLVMMGGLLLLGACGVLPGAPEAWQVWRNRMWQVWRNRIMKRVRLITDEHGIEALTLSARAPSFAIALTTTIVLTPPSIARDAGEAVIIPNRVFVSASFARQMLWMGGTAGGSSFMQFVIMRSE